jgi:hypothetical protein
MREEKFDTVDQVWYCFLYFLDTCKGTYNQLKMEGITRHDNMEINNGGATKYF